MANMTKKLIDDMVLKINASYNSFLKLDYNNFKSNMYTLYKDNVSLPYIVKQGSNAEIVAFLEGLVLGLSGRIIDIKSERERVDRTPKATAALREWPTKVVKPKSINPNCILRDIENKGEFYLTTKVQKQPNIDVGVKYIRHYSICITNVPTGSLEFNAKICNLSYQSGTHVEGYDCTTNLLCVSLVGLESVGHDMRIKEDLMNTLILRLIKKTDQAYINDCDKRRVTPSPECIMYITKVMCTTYGWNFYELETKAVKVLGTKYNC